MSAVEGLRSPSAEVSGLFYFGRMVDKIRLHKTGKLPADYHENLGDGFDARCTHFLHISYQALVDRVAEFPDATDEELLEWCYKQGQRPDEEDIEVWNGFLSKRGWNDEATPTVLKRKAAAGITARADITTFFQLIDLDEGRL